MQITTRAKLFISLFALLLACNAQAGEWKVDLSRRSNELRTDDLKNDNPADHETPAAAPAKGGFFENLFNSDEIAQEIVVLNTDKGFVPSTIRVRRGASYQIHVVNVNEKEKNVSFVLDSFSEHHATFYGKIKSFVIRPQKEGVFRFVSPETSAQGKLVVFPGGVENRAPASDE